MKSAPQVPLQLLFLVWAAWSPTCTADEYCSVLRRGNCKQPCTVDQTNAFQQLIGNATDLETLEACLHAHRRLSCETCMPILKTAYDGAPDCILPRFGEFLDQNAHKSYYNCGDEMTRVNTMDFMVSCYNVTDKQQIEALLADDYLSTIMCSKQCTHDTACIELLERAIKIVPPCAKTGMIKNSNECNKSNVVIPALQPRPTPTPTSSSSSTNHQNIRQVAALLTIALLALAVKL